MQDPTNWGARQLISRIPIPVRPREHVPFYSTCIAAQVQPRWWSGLALVLGLSPNHHTTSLARLPCSVPFGAVPLKWDGHPRPATATMF